MPVSLLPTKQDAVGLGLICIAWAAIREGKWIHVYMRQNRDASMSERIDADQMEVLTEIWEESVSEKPSEYVYDLYNGLIAELQCGTCEYILMGVLTTEQGPKFTMEPPFPSSVCDEENNEGKESSESKDCSKSEEYLPIIWIVKSHDDKQKYFPGSPAERGQEGEGVGPQSRRKIRTCANCGARPEKGWLRKKMPDGSVHPDEWLCSPCAQYHTRTGRVRPSHLW